MIGRMDNPPGWEDPDEEEIDDEIEEEEDDRDAEDFEFDDTPTNNYHN